MSTCNARSGHLATSASPANYSRKCNCLPLLWPSQGRSSYLFLLHPFASRSFRDIGLVTLSAATQMHTTHTLAHGHAVTHILAHTHTYPIIYQVFSCYKQKSISQSNSFFKQLKTCGTSEAHAAQLQHWRCASGQWQQQQVAPAQIRHDCLQTPPVEV